MYLVLTFYCIDIAMILNDIRHFECTNFNKGDLGYALQWVVLEIVAFFLNVIVLVLILA